MVVVNAILVESQGRLIAALKLVSPRNAEGGRFLANWRRPLTVVGPLPSATLPLTVEAAVSVDLEQTYQRAVDDAYLA